MLISYETYQFGWAEGDLRQGEMEAVRDGEGVLLVEKPGIAAAVGSDIELETKTGRQKVRVAGILGYAPLDSGEGVGTVICSEDLFRRLTGETGYTILDIQLHDKSDAVVEGIRSAAGENYRFSDSRKNNRETRAV